MTTRKFAAKTRVPVEQSKLEVERLLTRNGATSIVTGWTTEAARILFEAKGRRVRFELELHPIEGSGSSVDERKKQENRRRWRCLLLVIKAKFEAIASGITEFDEEFLSHIVVPGTDGETVGSWLGPQLVAAYERGLKMPPLLGSGDAP
jgi:hypothetical protein